MSLKESEAPDARKPAGNRKHPSEPGYIPRKGWWKANRMCLKCNFRYGGEACPACSSLNYVLLRSPAVASGQKKR